jgi:hypothetical protein
VGITALRSGHITLDFEVWPSLLFNAIAFGGGYGNFTAANG